MTYKIGSARHDENGKYSGGKAGDQRGDEAATQSYYEYPSKGGWVCYRAKSASHGKKIADYMKKFCADNRIGYSQSDRYSLLSDLKANKKVTKNVNTDCSALIRACIYMATGKDTGDFNTASEGAVLIKSGIFEKVGKVTGASKLYEGDILVTAQKGHTVAVVSGYERTATKPATTAKSVKSDSSITKIAKEVIAGKWGTGDARRVKLAAAGYDYTKVQAEVNKILKNK